MLRIFALILINVFIMVLSGCANHDAAPVDDAWNHVGSTQHIHRVQPGETIYSIAWRYGVSYRNLAAWNHLSPPYYLNLGQKLVVKGNHVDSNVVPSVVAPQKTILATPSFVPTASSSPAVKPVVVRSEAHTATHLKEIKPALADASVGKTASQKTTSASEPSDLSDMQPASANLAAVSSNGSNWPWPVKGKVISGFDQDDNKGIDIAVPAGTPVKAVQNGTVVYSGNNLHGYGQLLIVKQKDDILTAYAHNSRLLVKEGALVKKGETIAMSGNTEAPQSMLHFEVRQSGKPVNPLPYLKK